jgi:hypothetical protein
MIIRNREKKIPFPFGIMESQDSAFTICSDDKNGTCNPCDGGDIISLFAAQSINVCLKESKSQRGLFNDNQNYILQIPRKEFITKQTVVDRLKSELKSGIDKLNESNANDFHYILLYYQYLQLGNGTPKECQYFNLLPKMDSILNWNESSYEFLLLENTGLDKSVKAKLSSIKKEFEEFAIDGISFETYLELDMLVKSRLMDDEKMLCIVPIADFCNHSNDYNAKWIFSPAGLTITSTAKENEQEILISYGQKSNMELLFTYGFTIAENQYDTVSFLPTLLQETDRPDTITVMDKKHFINSQMLLVGNDGFFGILNEQSYLISLVSVLGNDDGFIKIDNQIAFNKKILTGPKELLQLINLYELKHVCDLKIVSIVLGMCLERCLELDLEIDESILGLNYKIGLVCDLRNGMVRILKEAIEKLKGCQLELLDNNVVKEYLEANQ